MNGYTSTNGGAGSINGTTAPVASSSALPLQPGLASAVGAQGSNGTSTPQQTYSYDHHQQDVERNYELAAYLVSLPPRRPFIPEKA